MWSHSLISIWLLIAACILVHKALGINGGEDANILNFPYVVSIRDMGPYEQHICGGALIGPGIVLTAAHCVFNIPRSVLQVYGGSADLTAGGSASLVSNMVVHPMFNSFHRYNDIAVLFLSTPFANSTTTRPIEIGIPTKVLHAEVAGWGQASANLDYSQKLQYLNVTIISNKRCYSISNRVMDSIICANASNQRSGTCVGDDGNPLVGEIFDSRYFTVRLVGLLSYTFKEECADGLLAVYTKVASYTRWIQKVIKKN